MIRRLQWAIVSISALLLLLIAAAFPWRGIPELYRSGVFLLVAAITALSAAAIWWRPAFRHRGGVLLLHLAIALIAVGALIGVFFGRQVRFFMLAEADAPLADFLPPENGRPAIPLPFSFGAGRPEVDYYDPDYLLYRRQPDDPNRMTLAGRPHWRGEMLYLDNRQNWPRTTLLAPDGSFLPHLNVGEDGILMRQDPQPSEYRVAIRYHHPAAPEERQAVLKVNEPVTIDRWRFYLMSCGTSARGRYVELLARQDPGRLVVAAGLWLLLAAPLWLLVDQWRKQ